MSRLEQNKHAFLQQCACGGVEHITWQGDRLEIESTEGPAILETGMPGTILQIGGNDALGWLFKDNLLKGDEISVLFRGGLICPIPKNSNWHPLPHPEADEITAAIKNATNQLLERDSQLLAADVNERTITGKLGSYLEAHFPQWDVDCEYNRIIYAYNNNKQFAKVIDLEAAYHQRPGEQFSFKKVYPDIIVHRRNTACNLLVIEVKKVSDDAAEYDNLRATDIAKLRAFHDQLGYRFTVYIALNVGHNPSVHEISLISHDTLPGLVYGQLAQARMPNGVRLGLVNAGCQLLSAGETEQ